MVTCHRIVYKNEQKGINVKIGEIWVRSMTQVPELCQSGFGFDKTLWLCKASPLGKTGWWVPRTSLFANSCEFKLFQNKKMFYKVIQLAESEACFIDFVFNEQ